MKHLTFLLALVLCASSLQAQFVTVTSVIYDSLETYFGDESYTATVDVQSNAVYTAEFHFFWSSDREEISNGGGEEILPSITITPGVLSRTDMYSLFPQYYASAGQFGGIYFRLYYDVVDDEGNIVQSYASPVRTWRFPTEISTAVSDQDASPVVSIYPNPTQDRFQIEGYSGLVQVTNALGQVVLSTWLGQGETADVSALPSGTYIILVGQTFLGRLQKL
jgi:hypothetical protein